MSNQNTTTRDEIGSNWDPQVGRAAWDFGQEKPWKLDLHTKSCKYPSHHQFYSPVVCHLFWEKRANINSNHQIPTKVHLSNHLLHPNNKSPWDLSMSADIKTHVLCKCWLTASNEGAWSRCGLGQETLLVPAIKPHKTSICDKFPLILPMIVPSKPRFNSGIAMDFAKWPPAQPWHPAGSSDHHLKICTISTMGHWTYRISRGKSRTTPRVEIDVPVQINFE